MAVKEQMIDKISKQKSLRLNKGLENDRSFSSEENVKVGPKRSQGSLKKASVDGPMRVSNSPVRASTFTIDGRPST